MWNPVAGSTSRKAGGSHNNQPPGEERRKDGRRQSLVTAGAEVPSAPFFSNFFFACSVGLLEGNRKHKEEGGTPLLQQN